MAIDLSGLAGIEGFDEGQAQGSALDIEPRPIQRFKQSGVSGAAEDHRVFTEQGAAINTARKSRNAIQEAAARGKLLGQVRRRASGSTAIDMGLEVVNDVADFGLGFTSGLLGIGAAGAFAIEHLTGSDRFEDIREVLEAQNAEVSSAMQINPIAGDLARGLGSFVGVGAPALLSPLAAPLVGTWGAAAAGVAGTASLGFLAEGGEAGLAAKSRKASDAEITQNIIIVGAINAALETAAPALISGAAKKLGAGRVIKGALGHLGLKTSMASRGASAAARATARHLNAAGMEFSTETMQSIVTQAMTGRVDPNSDMWENLDFGDALYEGMLGAVIGGGVSTLYPSPDFLDRRRGELGGETFDAAMDILDPFVEGGTKEDKLKALETITGVTREQLTAATQVEIETDSIEGKQQDTAEQAKKERKPRRFNQGHRPPPIRRHVDTVEGLFSIQDTGEDIEVSSVVGVKFVDEGGFELSPGMARAMLEGEGVIDLATPGPLRHVTTNKSGVLARGLLSRNALNADADLQAKKQSPVQRRLSERAAERGLGFSDSKAQVAAEQGARLQLKNIAQLQRDAEQNPEFESVLGEATQSFLTDPTLLSQFTEQDLKDFLADPEGSSRAPRSNVIAGLGGGDANIAGDKISLSGDEGRIAIIEQSWLHVADIVAGVGDAVDTWNFIESNFGDDPNVQGQMLTYLERQGMDSAIGDALMNGDATFQDIASDPNLDILGEQWEDQGGSVRSVDAETFVQHAAANKAASKFGAAVDVLTVEEYRARGDQLIATFDETGNVAATISVTPDGEITSLTRTPGAPRSAVDAAFANAIKSGGRWASAFGTVLPKLYRRYGMVSVARIKFDPEQAPADFDRETFKKFNDGQPDVVFMRYDPAVENNPRGKRFEDYGAAEALAREPAADLPGTALDRNTNDAFEAFLKEQFATPERRYQLFQGLEANATQVARDSDWEFIPSAILTQPFADVQDLRREDIGIVDVQLLTDAGGKSPLTIEVVPSEQELRMDHRRVRVVPPQGDIAARQSVAPRSEVFVKPSDIKLKKGFTNPDVQELFFGDEAFLLEKSGFLTQVSDPQTGKVLFLAKSRKAATSKLQQHLASLIQHGELELRPTSDPQRLGKTKLEQRIDELKVSGLNEEQIAETLRREELDKDLAETATYGQVFQRRTVDEYKEFLDFDVEDTDFVEDSLTPFFEPTSPKVYANQIRNLKAKTLEERLSVDGVPVETLVPFTPEENIGSFTQFLNATERPIRLFERLQGDRVNGWATDLFWKPNRVADVSFYDAFTGYNGIMGRFNRFAASKGGWGAFGQLYNTAETRDADGTNLELTGSERVAVSMMLKDAGAREKLIANGRFRSGTGVDVHISEEQAQRVADTLTREERQLQDFLRVYWNEQYKRAKEIADSLGIPLREVENYFPNIGDTVEGDGGITAGDLANISQFTTRIQIANNLLPKRFTLERSDSTENQVLLGDAIQAFYMQSRQMEWWISHAPAMTEIFHVLNDPTFKRAIRETFGVSKPGEIGLFAGRDIESVLRKWAENQARGGLEVDGFERVIRHLRTNSAAAILAGKMSVIAKQPISYTKMPMEYMLHDETAAGAWIPVDMARHFAGSLARGMTTKRGVTADVWRMTKGIPPPEGSRLAKLAELIPEIRSRNLNQEIKDLFETIRVKNLTRGQKRRAKSKGQEVVQLGGRVMSVSKDWVQQFLMRPILFMDLATLVIGADYIVSREMAKGKTEAEAADIAQNIIEKTQPMGALRALPDIYRGGEYVKSMLIFTNQINQDFNQGRRVYRAVTNSDLPKGDRAALAAWFLILYGGLASTMVAATNTAGRFYTSMATDERLKTLAAGIGDYASSMIPMYGFIGSMGASYLQYGKVFGTPFGNTGLEQLGAVGEDLLALATEPSGENVMDLLVSGATLGGAPAGAIKNAINGITDNVKNPPTGPLAPLTIGRDMTFSRFQRGVAAKGSSNKRKRSAGGSSSGL